MILTSVISALLMMGLPGNGDVRQPSPSPDGSLLLTVYRGDIWEVPASGGTMRCLAFGESIESSPCYSPDGALIAFTSNRSGGGDVYVMDSEGGTSRRLTYYGGDDRVLCFSACSDSVYFISSREGGSDWVWSVPISGGTPAPLIRVAARNLCGYGAGFLLERGFTPWWRRHYSGAASRDIWTGSGTSWEPLAATPVDERWPMYSPLIDQVLFVREDSSGNAALWSIPDDGEPVQRTHFDGGDISFPAISADGGTVVFEYDGTVMSVSLPSWETGEVPIHPGADAPFPLEYSDLVGFYTEHFDVDSSGAFMAVVAMGDLFAGEIIEGSLENVQEVMLDPGRIEDPTWSPDGSMLAFSLEKNGRVDLMLAVVSTVDSIDPRGELPSVDRVQTASDVAEYPRWSPDGTMISYLDADHMLHVVDFRTGSDVTVCETTGLIHHSWSPDGQWLAFSVPVLAHREEIFVVPSSGGEPVNVSCHPNDDFQPFWPDDGRRLIYASRTDEGDYSIRQVWFRREDWDLDDEERDELLDRSMLEVEIQFDGLQRRTETLCTVTGYYDFYGVPPDGRMMAFPAWDSSDRMDLWTVDWKGENLQRSTWSGESPSGILVTPDGTIYYIAIGGTVRSAISDGGVQSTFGWRMPVWRAITELQTQKFDEAWRLLRDNFYDPDMHGTDWEAIRDQYRDRAAACITNEEFNDVVRRMLGELSASHLGIWGPWGSPYTPRAASIGIIPDHRWDGEGIRVDSVIPFSPADLEGSKLYQGDLILTVHGEAVGADMNFYRPFLQRSGMETVLEVRRGGILLDMKIEPVSEWKISSLLADEWVERNRRTVSRLTDDRVGYLHIPSMNGRSVQRFLVDLFSEGLYRDGLIVDVRYNGGGNTHDQILVELDRARYAMSRDRSGNMSFEPLGGWQKPLVLLINERCYSDGEIFPAGWKELGLGPVVGESTYGAVIGTIDVDLVDGTTFRVPSTGWFTLDGVTLENTGVAPDIRVRELPADDGQGIDRQLDAGIAAILELLQP